MLVCLLPTLCRNIISQVKFIFGVVLNSSSLTIFPTYSFIVLVRPLTTPCQFPNFPFEDMCTTSTTTINNDKIRYYLARSWQNVTYQYPRKPALRRSHRFHHAARLSRKGRITMTLCLLEILRCAGMRCYKAHKFVTAIAGTLP